MRYMGGKFRVAKELSAYLTSVRLDGQRYWEPFLGVASVFRRMDNPRLGTDINRPLIAMLRAAQNGWTPPNVVTEEQYQFYRKSQGMNVPLEMYGFVGIAASYRGKWYSGYAHNVNRDFVDEGCRDLINIGSDIKGSILACCNYRKPVVHDYLIYADPPYEGGTQFKVAPFDWNEFWAIAQTWAWCNVVYVSYHSHLPRPNFAHVVWEKHMPASLRSKGRQIPRVEQLLRIEYAT